MIIIDSAARVRVTCLYFSTPEKFDSKMYWIEVFIGIQMKFFHIACSIVSGPFSIQLITGAYQIIS